MRGFTVSRFSMHVRATVVTYVGDSTYEIRMDGAVIGLILRRDRTFVARAGPLAGETLTARSACSGTKPRANSSAPRGSDPHRHTDTASQLGFNDGISCPRARILAVLTANVASRLISIPTP